MFHALVEIPNECAPHLHPTFLRMPDMLYLLDSVEALTDPTVWAVTLISFTNALPTGGLGAFSNLIISAFVRVTVHLYLIVPITFGRV